MTDDDLPFLRKLARTQRFTLGAPKEFAVAPDGSRVLFLRSAGGYDRTHNLHLLDVASGTETTLVDAHELETGELPAAERARRERTRETGAGVVRFAADDHCRMATFSLGGVLYTVDVGTGAVQQLVDGAVFDPRPNPQGTHVAYVKDGALRVIDRASGDDRVLVDEPGEDISWGSAEFIAEEEMGRTRGYWWSPDGRRLIVQRTDIGPVRRWHIANPAEPAADADEYAYPAAGTPNAVVTLSVLGLDGSRADVPVGDWEYLAAVHWSAGGPPLLAVQPRDQRRLDVLELDPDGQTTRLLARESNDAWVELIRGVPAWTSDGRLVRVTEAGDSYRLLVDETAVSPPQLQVRSVLHVGDEVLFSASESDPTQIHLYRTNNGAVDRLSTVEGINVGSGTAACCVLSAWSLDYAGPRVEVLVDGKSTASVASHTADPGVVPNVTLLTTGQRALRSAVLLPSGYTADDGALPVLLDPYGGPHAQRVLSTRNAFLTSQWFADQGFAVVVTDGRGSPGRGPAWDKAIGGEPAEISLSDQVDALTALGQQRRELDLTRVAIRGWSYGGYLAALAVLRRSDVFHAAVAGAPVTDWRLYDTHYTERYLGHPDTDAAAYDRNSLLSDAPNLRRPLLLVHGLADDNVFVAHTLRLSAALLAAGRQHSCLPLVNITHMTPQDENVAQHLMQLQVDWLKAELPAADGAAVPVAAPAQD